MWWYVPAMLLGGAAASKMAEKGKAMIEEAGGLGGVGEDLLSRMDLFDVFGTKAAAEERKAKAQDAKFQRAAKRTADAERKAQEANARNARDIEKVRSEQAVHEAREAKERAALDKRFTEAIGKLRMDITRQLAAVKASSDKASRAAAEADRKALDALQRAISAANKPNAPDGLRDRVDAAREMVAEQGVLPSADLFSEYDLSSFQGDRPDDMVDNSISWSM